MRYICIQLKMLKYISVCICLLLYCKFISGKVCYVKFDEAGIIYNSTLGKDREYNNSTYKNSTLLKFESNWEERNSLNSSDMVEKLILDQRWENFLVTDTINNNILTEYAFSAKIYSQVSNLLPEEPPRWKHFYVKRTGDNEFKIKEKGTDGLIHFKMELKPNNMYKIHNFTYYYNEEVERCNDFKPKTSNILLPVPRWCLHFYTAMCENCSISVEIHKNGKVNETTITSKSNGDWNLYNICANNVTNDFWVRICANEIDRGFWAIAPQWILSSCENDFRFLEWTDNEKDVTGCENVNNINISKNENLNQTCKLYATSKNEAMILEPTEATTTSSLTISQRELLQPSGDELAIKLATISLTFSIITITLTIIALVFCLFRKRKDTVNLNYGEPPHQYEEIKLVPDERAVVTKKIRETASKN